MKPRWIAHNTREGMMFSPQQVRDLNLIPYAVYGGKVHSCKVRYSDTMIFSTERLNKALEEYHDVCFKRGIEPDFPNICDERKRHYLR